MPTANYVLPSNDLHPLHELKELEESFSLIISFTLSLSTLKDYMQAIKIHCQLINYYMQYSDLCVSKLVSSVKLSLFLEVSNYCILLSGLGAIRKDLPEILTTFPQTDVHPPSPLLCPPIPLWMGFCPPSKATGSLWF